MKFDPKITQALLDIIAGVEPGRAGRTAQDYGLCDNNKWDGWTINANGFLWLERAGE